MEWNKTEKASIYLTNKIATGKASSKKVLGIIIDPL
jgi:hypothetical protein